MGRHSDTQARHRVQARTHRLSNTYVCGGFLLIFTFGITVGAAHEAYVRQDRAWMILFALAALAVVGLYFELVNRWIKLVGLSD